PSSSLHCFDLSFPERRENQQYFYSRSTARLLIDAVLDFFHHDHERVEREFACVCAPSIAEILYREYSISVHLFDIDTRFSFLPLFTPFDLLSPPPPSSSPFSLIVFDPPYFGVPISTMRTSLSLLSSSNTRYLIGFLRRDEHLLLNEWPGLSLTNTQLEYDRVRESRWPNYGLYSNCDLHGIRRVKDKKKEHKKK
ncbi:hypothetical protein PFISCL1PPCAC_8017, partial [Pristionchus fissidentatus]